MPNPSRNQRLFASRDLTDGLSFRASLASSLTPEIAGSGAPAFARSTIGNYLNASLSLSQAAIDAPRFDYSQGMPGILIEPTATNSNLWSESLDAATSGLTYGKIKSGIGVLPVVTANYATAPDGTTTADRVALDATGSTTTSDYSRIYQSISVMNGTQYSYSAWVKSNTADSYFVIFRDDGAGIFNVMRTVTPYWQRFSFTGTAGSANAACGLWCRPRSGTSSYIDVSVWGLQMESGPPTSYVKSTSSPSARGADKLSYPANEHIDYRGWTISVWFRPVWDNSDGFARYFFDTGSAIDRNRLTAFKDSDNKLKVRLYGNNAGTYRGISASASSLADKWRNLTAWGDKSGPGGMAIDGFSVGSMDNSGSWSDATQLGATISLGSDLNQTNQAAAILSRASIWNRARPEIYRSIYSRGF